VLPRFLLTAVTALIVARPQVLGEDPGLSAAGSDNGSVVLSLLWLVTGVAWATWTVSGRNDSITSWSLSGQAMNRGGYWF
jgi:hypothetical protein